MKYNYKNNILLNILQVEKKPLVLLQFKNLSYRALSLLALFKLDLFSINFQYKKYMA